MTFPRKPETDDERRAELLRLSGVRGFPKVFILGSFARYVTIYAQQVRALNLVDALAKSGALSERSRVAVVGGGIAGLTAAAGAAVRGVRRVDVFEQHESTMRIQRNSHQRFVHPHLYDWPIRSGLGDDAGLPLMSWTAGSATEVVTKLDERWQEVREATGGRLGEPRTSCGELGIRTAGGRPAVELAAGDVPAYDAVLLAIGFGLDTSDSTPGYWADSEIDSLDVASDTSWLVSGAGDGALTDLMRLCILDFKHSKVLKEVVQVAEKAGVGQTLLAKEPECETARDFEELYREAARKIQAELSGKLRKRQLEKVWLNASREGLFRPSSSILNRLITAYLLNEERFELAEGRIETPERAPDGGFRVAFQEAERSLEVDHVVVRHGPDKPLDESGIPRTWQPFPAIWRSTRQIRRQWAEARQNDDWTRERLFEDRDFDPETASSAPLRIDFGDRLGCVLVTGENERKLQGQTHATRVRNALRRFHRGLESVGGPAVDTEPRHLRAADVFSSSAAYERAVRALCEAEIAVFDVTDTESAVMLLLGIRATARRGITLTVTTADPADNALPFNLSALNPMLIGRTDDAKRVAAGIESGMSALKAQPRAYLDLPVFDAVRQLGEDHVPLEPEDQILVLRWFEERYRELVDPAIGEPLSQKFDNDESVVTVLDSMSPQLVGQRLYAAIRRTRLCIADWTGWRPNVFFEIGVRLSVNKTDPLFVFCKQRPRDWRDGVDPEWPASPDPWAEQLTEFFDPVGFEVDDSGEFEQRIQEFVERREVRAPDAKLSPGRTYAIVSETVDRAWEPGGRPVYEDLSNEAEALAGPAVPEGGMAVPVLFGDVLADRAQRAATEHQLAAWYYLGERYRLFPRSRDGASGASRDHRGGSPPDPRLGALLRVGRELLDRIRKLPDDEYGPFAADIRAAIQQLDPDSETDDE